MSGTVTVDASVIAAVKQRLEDCTKLLETYEWLINSFVLDFFIDSHWPHLPSSWQSTLSTSSPSSLASLLDPSSPAVQDTVWPLSLLAFKQSIHSLSLDRQPVDDFKFAQDFIQKTQYSHKQGNKRLKVKDFSPPNSQDPKHVTSPQKVPAQSFGQSVITNKLSGEPPVVLEDVPIDTKTETKDEKWPNFEFYPDMFSVFSGHNLALKHIFRKHLKPKKQYELARLGKFSRDVMEEIDLTNLIDVGAGVGHLARYLAYAHNLQVACVDSNTDFTDAAHKFDAQLEKSVRRLEDSKGGRVLVEVAPPVHVNAYLHPDMPLQGFHKILAEKFQISDSALHYGIIGLHTCGDLGPVLIKMFAADTKASVLFSVGCCYMKIENHFPMSSFLSGHMTTWKLTYTNAELACHAIEMYTDRLRTGEQDKLKVHCYRAVLEKLLVFRDPALRHTILKTVAKAHLLSFEEYATKATSKLTLEIDPSEFNTEQIKKELTSWWDVVTYYTLRLAMAPILETVILLDRCVYLYEQGFSSVLVPLFDPVLSPRNQLIFAHRTHKN